MKRFKSDFRIKRVLAMCNVRYSIKECFYIDSILTKDIGVFYGLYIADKITFSSYLRLEALIKKVMKGQIISLR